jgi:hypothetical protein
MNGAFAGRAARADYGIIFGQRRRLSLRLLRRCCEPAGDVMKREFFSDDIRSARTAVSQNHEDIIVVPANGHKADLEDTKGCA